MNKTRIVLFAILVAIIVFGIYARIPARIDGSSAEAFEKSTQTIQDALPDREKGQFRQDIQDALAGVGTEHPNLLSTVMLSQLAPAKGKAAEAELMEKLREQVDGMTLDEFRVFAASGREKKKGVMDRAMGERPRERPKGPEPAKLDIQWADEAALLAAAPQIETNTQEFEFERRAFLIDIPSDATIEEGKIRLASGEVAKLQTWLKDLSDIHRVDSSVSNVGTNAVVFSDERTQIEQPGDERGNRRPEYKTWMNVALSEYTEFGVVLAKGDGFIAGSMPIELEPTLSLVRCVKTLRLKEAEPSEPLALAKVLGARFRPYRPESPKEVMKLELGSCNAAALRILSFFPDLIELEFRNPSTGFTVRRGDPNPLQNCRNLARLSIDGWLKNEDANAVFNSSELTDLKLASGLYSDADWLRRLPELRKLERLTLELNRDELAKLSVLTDCRKLRFLRLVLRQSDSGSRADPSFLAPLHDLRELELQGEMSPTVIGSLSRLGRLESLYLDPAMISDDPLKPLRNSVALKRLTLTVNEGHISPKSFVALVNLPLEYIKIHSLKGYRNPDQAIGDEHLEWIAKIKSIKELELHLERLTVAGLEHLKSLPNLKTVTLGYACKIEDDAMEHFRASEPGFEIVR